jgi:hypothetical protein
MIPHSTIRNKECITDGKSSITEIIGSRHYSEAFATSIMENPSICGTTFPSGKKIAKQQIEATSSEDVLRDSAFAATIASHVCHGNEAVQE